MIINKQVTTVEQVEVTLPYFSKSMIYTYKVVSENTVIRVENSTDDKGITVSQYGVSLAFGDGTQPITQAQFNNAYQIVLNHLTNIASDGTL